MKGAAGEDNGLKNLTRVWDVSCPIHGTTNVNQEGTEKHQVAMPMEERRAPTHSKRAVTSWDTVSMATSGSGRSRFRLNVKKSEGRRIKLARGRMAKSTK